MDADYAGPIVNDAFLYGREDTIRQMNRLGNQNRGFFFFISYDMETNILAPFDEPAPGLFYHLPGKELHLPRREQRPLPSRWRFRAFPPGREAYEKAFDQAQFHLQRGNSYLLNLTQPSSIDTDLTLEQFFTHARTRYKVLVRHGQNGLTCFSPETFVTLEDNRISTFPMKGTIRAAVPRAAARLLENDKEAREHATIVDLLRNDLSMVAQRVEVTRYRYVQRVATAQGNMLQTSSEITGELDSGWPSSVGDMLFAMLPAGSVTGAPKPASCLAIEEAEGYQRGFYTGVFGYYANRSLQSAVAIRFIEKQHGVMTYKSGGGITTMSRCDDEYDELTDKIYAPFVV